MNSIIKTRIEEIKSGKVPRGYKKTKIGIFPVEWEEKKFKTMFYRLQRKNEECNTNVLTISAQYGLINQGDFFNKEVASDDKSNYYLINKGEWAYNKSYSSGYPFGAIKRLEKYDKGIVSPLYICFSQTQENKCPDFYLQYFENGLLDKEIKAIAQEGARNHGLLDMGIDDFFNTTIIVPPVDAQQKIAEILQTQDRIIELKEKLLEQKKLQKKYLMQQLLTGSVRLKGFTDEWKQVKIGKIAVMNSGGTPESDNQDYYGNDYVWVSIKDMTSVDKYISNSIRKLSKLGLENCSAKIFPIGTILFAMYASVGECCITSVECCTSQAILGIRVSSQVIVDYLYYWLSCNKDNFKSIAQASSQPNLNKGIVERTKIKLPLDKEEQQAIVNILSAQDKEIKLLKSNLDQEKQKKKSLMQLLLSGIVRVG